jgi:hypothetical protein
MWYLPGKMQFDCGDVHNEVSQSVRLNRLIQIVIILTQLKMELELKFVLIGRRDQFIRK